MNTQAAAITAYRALLRVFPGGFRAEFEAEMVEVFRQQLDSAAAGGYMAMLALLLREAGGLAAGGLRARIYVQAERPVLLAAAGGREDMTMTWIAQNKRAWRAVLLLLLVVAFLGPWNMGLAHELAQFECPPPYTRLEGDFCGWPRSGLRMGFEIARGVVFSVGSLLGGETSLARPLLTTSIILLPFVPVALTLAVLWRGSGRGLRRVWPFWLLGLLAVILYLLFMAASGSELGFPYLRYVWGAWLYVILAAAMVVGEGIVRIAGRGRPRHDEVLLRRE